MGRWPDGQNSWSSLDLDFVSQPRNLKQRLGKADPPRVADFDQLGSNHDQPPKTCSHCSHVGSLRVSLLWLTRPLRGRQGVSGARSQFMAACPLEGPVGRCRISRGSVCRPTLHVQSSSHLRFASHTRAQLQTQGRDHLQDGVKARTALSRQGFVEALPGKP